MSLKLSDVRKYENLEFLARKIVEGFMTGLHRSPFSGFSVEFAEHKLFNPGDSVRHIDWKVFARTDKVFHKRYQEETNLRCRILIDVSSSMYYPSQSNDKIQFSLYAAAAICHLLQQQRDAVGITTFAENIEWESAIKSTKTHIHSLIISISNLLKEHSSSKNSNISLAIDHIAQTSSRRSLIIIFTDMLDKGEKMEQLFQALQHLQHQKNEILLFHVMDSNTERKFDWDNKPFEFTDAESGEKIKLIPTQLKEAYSKRMIEWQHDIAIKSGKYGIDFIEVDSGESFDQVLLSYLMKRKKMVG